MPSDQINATGWKPGKVCMPTPEEKAQLRAHLFSWDITRVANTESSIMGIRWQVWAGSITLVSLLSLITVPGPEAYAASIAPWLLAFASQYAGSSEGALRIIRLFYRSIAELVEYTGSFEEFYDSFVRDDHGGGRQGLRNTLVLCQATITALIILRFWRDLLFLLPRWPTLTILVVGLAGTAILGSIESLAICKTWYWLREKPLPKKKETNTLEDQANHREADQEVM